MRRASSTRNGIRFKSSILLAFAATGFVPSALGDATNASTTEWEMPLSEVLANRASGLRHEGLETQQLEQLRAQARAFLEYRRSRPGAKQKVEFVSGCLERKSPSAFCRYVDENGDFKRRPGASGNAATKTSPRADTYRIADAIGSAKLGDLSGFSESQFHKAFTLFPNAASIDAAAKAALNSSCLPSPFLTAFGQKYEQFFPEPSARARALALFERSARCGSDESSQKAAFRASLLHVWEGRCEAAVPHLERLSEIVGGDYSSRSLYWRASCAREQGNKLLARVMTSRLLKEHPLSFHGLLLGGATPSPELRTLLDSEDPMVRFRTERLPELNPLVRGAEMLLDLDAADLARTILDDVLSEAEKSEPAFRAYLAILFGRAGDRIGQFKSLAGVFREDNRFITRSTLELFYPLKRFDALKPQGKKVDPYLLAALIRQESGFNEHARSSVGALGLMQLMPATARAMQRRISKSQILKPENNIRLGAQYYHRLLERFDFDAELALAAYNAGPERVDEWRRRYTTENRMVFFDLIPYKETRDYVALIARNYFWYLSLYDDRDFRMKDEEGRLPASLRNAKPLVFTLFRR